MALGDLARTDVVENGRASRKAASLSSRYASCDRVVEGESVRLAFKRYSAFDATERSDSRLAVVQTGSENRVDVMADDAYGDAAAAWALFMFNRLQTEDLNPLRFFNGARVGVLRSVVAVQLALDRSVGE